MTVNIKAMPTNTAYMLYKYNEKGASVMLHVTTSQASFSTPAIVAAYAGLQTSVSQHTDHVTMIAPDHTQQGKSKHQSNSELVASW